MNLQNITDPVELQYRYEERAAIYEFDGKLSREEAERRAKQEVYDYKQEACD